jgi:hypothetical protein
MENENIIERLREIHEAAKGKGDQGAWNVWNAVAEIVEPKGEHKFVVTISDTTRERADQIMADMMVDANVALGTDDDASVDYYPATESEPVVEQWHGFRKGERVKIPKQKHFSSTNKDLTGTVIGGTDYALRIIIDRESADLNPFYDSEFNRTGIFYPTSVEHLS